ncbi:hypothetical protein SUDANB6_01126 [Streptomyces sp. enrichment culture]
MLHEVGSSTVGRAVSEIRPLLAERGFTVRDAVPAPRAARPGAASRPEAFRSAPVRTPVGALH